MMSQGILEELQVVGIAFVSGAVITIVYDLLRIFRRVIAHGNWWIGIEDFIFWIWTALWIFSVLYRENDGSFRMYTMGSMAVGMIIYHKTISEPLVEFFGKMLKKLLRIILFPIKRLKIYIIFLGKKLKNMIQGIIMKLEHYNR
ncbi:MAG: spore cortex biosynthesis protein YabQ [Lachnospiraceae bacterium]|nr:spore cortex biosynthesis protein YabQ [Lachnospiraceae bacterium]